MFGELGNFVQTFTLFFVQKFALILNLKRHGT